MTETAQNTGIGTLSCVALDTENPEELAQFYTALTGMQRTDDGSDDQWLSIGSADRGRICFQKVEKHIPPAWPAAENGQQMHLDFDVEDLQVAGEQVGRSVQLWQTGAIRAFTSTWIRLATRSACASIRDRLN